MGKGYVVWLVTRPKLTGPCWGLLFCSATCAQSCKRVPSRDRVHVPAALTTADWLTARPLARSMDTLSLPCRAHTPAGQPARGRQSLAGKVMRDGVYQCHQMNSLAAWLHRGYHGS